MKIDLENDYTLISHEKIETFVENNQETLTLLNALKPQLKQHFPKTNFSLEVCDRLEWTTDIKPNFSDMIFDLQIDIFDVNQLIDEIKEEE